MIGIVNINKPKGISSSKVVLVIKHLINEKKVGHLGTLDPLASGVLPIAIGRATRLFDFFLKKSKTYIATFRFGIETDTLDLEGNVIKTSENIPSKSQLDIAVKSFLGNILQTPPIYSSKKINGQTAYKLARKGQNIDLKPCNIHIYKFKVLRKIDEETFEFLIDCSSGTYIRALARDLGKKVFSCATMTSLIRIRSGSFDIKNALDYDKLSAENISKNLISLEKVLEEFKKVEISKDIYFKLKNGQKINLEKFICKNENYVVECDGRIVGIGKKTDNYFKITTYLE